MPFIHEGNWPLFCRQGWRWYTDFKDDEQDRLISAHLVSVYGPERIAIGTAYGENGPTCLPELLGFAFYLNDVTEQVEGLLEDIVNFECGHAMFRTVA